MSEQDEISKLIQAAELEVQAGKKGREDSLRKIMEGKSSPEDGEESPPGKREKPSTAGWEDWKLGKEPDETPEARKRKTMINVGILAVVIIGVILLIQFHFLSLKAHENRKTSSDLPLSQVRIGEKAETGMTGTADDNTQVPANFSGVKDGVVYHKGEPSAKPPSVMVENPMNTGNIQEARRQQWQKIREKEKEEKADAGHKAEKAPPPTLDRIEMNIPVAEDGSVSMPPGTPPHVLEHMKRKHREQQSETSGENVGTSGPGDELPQSGDGAPILAW